MHPGDVFCADGDGMIVLRGEHLLNAIERAHQDAATEDRHVDSAGASSQRPGEAELVTIGIGQVEEPLAPFGIARRRIWAVAGRDHSRMEGVNVGVVEDHASPPGPLALGRLRDEIEIAGSRPEARECCVLTAVNDLKFQHAIEADGPRHIVGGERDGADALDHGGNAP